MSLYHTWLFLCHTYNRTHVCAGTARVDSHLLLTPSPSPVSREYESLIRPNQAPFPPWFPRFPDPPLTRYWVRPRAASVEVLIRWLSVGQVAGQRRMGADSGGSHTPSSQSCRRLRSLLIVPEKLQQQRPFSALSPPLVT